MALKSRAVAFVPQLLHFTHVSSEGKRPLGRPRHRWVDNIKMYLGDIGRDGVDWIDMA
jgi:hypothetical protein